jgi:hypothetical protein
MARRPTRALGRESDLGKRGRIWVVLAVKHWLYASISAGLRTRRFTGPGALRGVGF